MKITWVNHASFIFEYDNIKLITDPWLEGTAFDNGWSLLSKTQLKYEDFASITHIWFSHEHPDHFSPPNIGKIPPGIKKNITVLFQNTIDRKVAKYCQKEGFKEIIEMQEDTYYKLSDKVEVLCNPFTDGDSYLYIKTDTTGLLNINDCLIDSLETAKSVQARVGKTDILFTQFCYANKVGNKDDVTLRVKASAEKLQRIKYQDQVFNPSVIIPFASYVYFSHEENFYMNNGFNKVGAVYDFIRNELKKECVVLYPGEEWETGITHASGQSINKYEADYSKMAIAGRTETIEELKLKEQSVKFVAMLKKQNTSGWLNFLAPMKVFITDYNKSFSFSIKHGLYGTNEQEINCDLSLSSEALFYAFKFLWGGDTLQVNARFQVPANGMYLRARQYFTISSLNNRGISIKPSEIFDFIRNVQTNKIKRLFRSSKVS